MDLVVLTDRRAEAEPDYCRIRGSCAERNVPLLDLFGLDQIALHRELQEQSYLTIPEWKELLSRYDAVSFPVPGAVVKYNKLQECWVARRRFLILYRWLLEQGKPVLFFREKEELAGALEAEGIEVRGRLMERSGNDRGYLRLAEQYRGKRILHIGTDPVADGIVPREYGMDSRMIRGFHPSYSLSGTGGTGRCPSGHRRRKRHGLRQSF